MSENVVFLEQVQNGIYMTVLICLALLLFVGLIRAVKGPQVADRLVAVNMMGTIVMVMIALLSLLLGEEFLLDICLIYAMVSFLAVIVLSKVYIGVYEENRHNQAEDQTAENKAAGDKTVETKSASARAAGDAGTKPRTKTRKTLGKKAGDKHGMD